MSEPIDQPQRTRFITELEQNFSVVASAGSGKTRAITDRIIAIARSEKAREWLPALVVVTYTNRAADEMQQRARQSILEAGVKLEIIEAFNRAFFGTIHSLCMRLLSQHGHHLDVPGQLAHLDDDGALWMEFIQQHAAIGHTLTAPQRRCLLRLAPVRELLKLGRSGPPLTAVDPGEFPAPAFDAVYAAAGKGNAKATIASAQERLRAWETAWRKGEGFLPFPACGTTAKDFTPLWEAAIGPLREWVRRAALCIAAETGRSYRDYRLARGAMNYDDQIALAAELLRHPEAGRRIRAKSYRVILDEAQDTDPAQFDVLLEIARPPEAAGAWLENGAAPPRPGHFSMVGDFQQSIYGARADLAHYRRVHDALLAANTEALEFSVTFRLDQRALDFANATFPAVLDGAAEQVAFVPLNARPGVLPGQIVRCELGKLPDISEWNDTRKAWHEAAELTRWLRGYGLQNLRASSWREVAILCPRTRWFGPLRRELRAAGLDAQILSERELRGDSPAYAWFTALAVIMAEPRHGYEIVGVLREVFGLSDHDLAEFAEGDGGRWQIAAPTARSGVVADTLNLLSELRARLVTLPLFTAMEEMVRVTQLRERLLSLPDGEYENLGAELGDLLTQSATAEAHDATLASWADELRGGFGSVRDVRPAARDALQLITGHKAKGSEWQVVVVPFFARAIKPFPAKYPRLVRDPRTRSTVALMDLDGDLKAALDARAQQECERLLYVALTRCRHTLVLVDDRALFSGKNGPSKSAQASLLRCCGTDVNAAAFDALPTAPVVCRKTAAHESARAHDRSRNAARPLDPFPRGCEHLARGRATHFIKRNPSALAEAALADADPAAYLETARRIPTDASPGAAYGTWWHGFIEHLDWRADAAAWDATFADALPTSPDEALSQHEWALLRAQLTGGSDIARLLTAPGVIAHAEMPFLWAMNERECLEGIIDLAVFDPAAGSWLIVDWKTNRTSAADIPQLSAHYLPQLSAYWQAIGAMLGTPVAAGLYSTATGRWLAYETPALAAEWKRLSAAPASIAHALSER